MTLHDHGRRQDVLCQARQDKPCPELANDQPDTGANIFQWHDAGERRDADPLPSLRSLDVHDEADNAVLQLHILQAVGKKFRRISVVEKSRLPYQRCHERALPMVVARGRTLSRRFHSTESYKFTSMAPMRRRRTRPVEKYGSVPSNYNGTYRSKTAANSAVALRLNQTPHREFCRHAHHSCDLHPLPELSRGDDPARLSSKEPSAYTAPATATNTRPTINHSITHPLAAAAASPARVAPGSSFRKIACGAAAVWPMAMHTCPFKAVNRRTNSIGGAR